MAVETLAADTGQLESGCSRYLALFEIVTTDLPAVFRYKMHGTEPPPAFDRERTFGYTYGAIGRLLVGDEIGVARAKQSQ